MRYQDGGAVFSIADVTQNEGNTANTMTFTITIDSPCRKNITYTVDWATANNSAIAGSDYTASNNTVTYTQGNSSVNSGQCGTKTFTVPILGDTVVEGNENFYVNLTNATTSNVTYPVSISDNQALGTITNDDVAPPEIDIVGFPTNSTDSSYGSIDINGQTIEKTYTIQNTGSGVLTIGTISSSIASPTACRSIVWAAAFFASLSPSFL